MILIDRRATLYGLFGRTPALAWRQFACISEWAKNASVGVENHNGARANLLPLIQPGVQRASDNVDHILRRLMRLPEDGGFSGLMGSAGSASVSILLRMALP